MAFQSITRNDVVSLIGAVPFFEVLDPESRKKMGERAFPKTFDKGETIVGQGDYGHTMFILGSGSVRIEAVGDNGQTNILATLDRPGQYFGEVALLGRARRSATVVAETITTLIEIEKTVVEQANKKVKGKVFDYLRKSNSVREISAFLSRHRFFTELDEETMAYIAGEAKLHSVERGKTIFTEEDPDSSIMLIKASMAKLVRMREEGGRKTESILSYYNVGDIIGLKSTASRKREVRLVSMGYCEVIEINRDVLQQALQRDHPDLYKSLSEDASARGEDQSAILQKGKTVAIFVGAFLNEGAQEGQSLLNINLNKCVRCGNCVKACHDRHGYSRFSRRGKKLTRRTKMDKAGNHETILLPASCRHCVNPECMIGCPTGAIHRKSSGEVDIHDFCIGCASCANRCPWGNITMITTKKPRIVPAMVDGKQIEVERPQIATKCNLCHGFDYANCVNNCPTGAILRVDPTQYFEEIAEVFRAQQGQNIGHSTLSKRRRIELTHPILGLLFMLVTAALVGIKGYEFIDKGGHTPYSWQMLSLGGVALACFFGAVTLAGRRRIKGFKVSSGKDKETGDPTFKSFQFGAFLTWTRAHLYIGSLALVATLLHAGGQFGGTVTSMIMWLTLAVIATGVFGVTYYKWLPRRITSLEGDSQVEEDLIIEKATLTKRRDELLEGASPGLKAISSKASSGSVLSRFSSSYDLQKAQEAALNKLMTSISSLSDDGERQTADRVINDAVRMKDIDACRLLYRIRRGWLVFHIGVAASLITLVILHVAIVLAFRV